MKAILASCAVALAMSAALPASAAVITQYVGQNIGQNPYKIDLGVGSVTFSIVDPFSFSPVGVQTSGAAQVFSVGAPFYPQPTPTSYFLDRGGSFGPGELGFFASYATPTAIPFSIVDGLIGFGFTLADGLHYGYAQVGGDFLTGFRFESVPGVGVALGAISAPVPEPAVWAMLISGFGMVGAMLRRRPRSLATLAA